MLAHVDGYARSRPVRVGNAAYCQQQTDICEFADWALLYHTLGEPLDATLEEMVRGVADHVAVQ